MTAYDVCLLAILYRNLDPDSATFQRGLKVTRVDNGDGLTFPVRALGTTPFFPDDVVNGSFAVIVGGVQLDLIEDAAHALGIPPEQIDPPSP